MTNEEAIKVLEKKRYEIINGHLCSQKPYTEEENEFGSALTYVIEMIKKEGEAQTVLEAWQSIFGTTQLTHAQARLEEAEKRAKKYDEIMIKVDEDKIEQELLKITDRENLSIYRARTIVQFLRGEK